MPNLALVMQISGEVDYDSRSPVLIEDTGRRWRLRNADGLLIGDRVTISATKEDYATLLVRAVDREECEPRIAYHRCH